MSAPVRYDPVSLAKGRIAKRLNALTGLVCGGVPAALLARYFRPTIRGAVVGFLIGLVWANAFEYVYHRWLLHWPRSSFGQRHLLHHMSVGRPNEPEHTVLGGSPAWIVVLFTVNGIPLTLMVLLSHWTFGTTCFIGFWTYLVTVEEIHWRIHMGGWMPSFLASARALHMAHHDRADQDFNVFLPLFDLLLGTAGR